MQKFAILTILAMHLAFVGQLNADGNVTVAVNNGNLRVTGTNGTEHTMVMDVNNLGQVTFESLDGLTTFNGAAMLHINGFNGDVRIDMKSGPKVIVLSDRSQPFAIPGNLRITTAGNELAMVVLIGIDVDGSTEIKTKNGEDGVFFLGGSFSGQVKVSTGNGNDVVGSDFSPVFNGKFTFQAGSGDDYFLSYDSVFLDVADLKLGSGNDGAAFFGTDVASLRLNGNNGFDLAGSEDSMFIAPVVLNSIEGIGDPNVIRDDAEGATILTLLNQVFLLL